MVNKLELEQHALLQRVVSNDVHWVDALKLIQPARKAWHTQEWKEQRKLLLGAQCQSCGTTTPPLVLQHTWHPTPLYRLFYKARKKYKSEWLAWKQSHAVNVDTSSLLADADGCPKCGSTVIRYRKIARTWICASRPAGKPCGHVFDEPVRVVPHQTIRKLERAARQRVQDAFDDQFGIGRKVTITAIEQQIRYLSLKDTKTLCKRCAFVEDRTRMVLCAVCKENYHFKKYDRCSGCAGIDKRVKRRRQIIMSDIEKDNKPDIKNDAKKAKHVLVDVKNLKEEQLDAAIDEALDALFGKDEAEKPAASEKAVRVGKKGTARKARK